MDDLDDLDSLDDLYDDAATPATVLEATKALQHEGVPFILLPAFLAFWWLSRRRLIWRACVALERWIDAHFETQVDFEAHLALWSWAACGLGLVVVTVWLIVVTR